MKIIKILHLDDHSKITDSIGQLLNRIANNIEYTAFSEPINALNFVEKTFTDNQRIDFILTDFTHPGINGYKFGETARNLEKLLKIKPCRILLLTLLKQEIPIIQKALRRKIFDGYCSLLDRESDVENFLRKNVLIGGNNTE